MLQMNLFGLRRRRQGFVPAGLSLRKIAAEDGCHKNHGEREMPRMAQRDFLSVWLSRFMRGDPKEQVALLILARASFTFDKLLVTLPISGQ
jgi:hypothetical protein